MVHYQKQFGKEGNEQQMHVFRISITVLSAVVTVMGMTSGHLLCASTIIKKCCPMKGPAKSTWTLCHGLDGQLHGCSSVDAVLFLSNFVQRIQVLHLSLATIPRFSLKTSSSLSRGGLCAAPSAPSLSVCLVQ